MDAKLYLNKAIMQLSRGLEESGVQSLKDALASEGDEISKMQAHVILGEYFVMKGDFTQARAHLDVVAEEASELQEKYDDLLDDEIFKADMLLEMIDRFGFLTR